MSWFTKNAAAGYTSTTPSKISGTAYLWDDTEKYVDWQLANVKTRANDKAVALLDKYTDGYAMGVTLDIDATLCANTVACGFCIYADSTGASCVLALSTGTALGAYTSLWIPADKFTTAGTTMTANLAAAVATPATNSYKIKTDNVNGFNGNWSCSNSASGTVL